MIVWKMIRRLATTAQKTPAGWLGTVLPLITIHNLHANKTENKHDSLDVIAINKIRGVDLVGFKVVDSFDVGDHDVDRAREDENEGNETENAYGVQAHKGNCKKYITNQQVHS